mmetsp:Transcript_20572/g.27111  ORF Transcript_20572/g.27111 Transcript_20572/m.27111 type:complete len:499 (+) Transcript_20572:225-1721(+)
MDGEQTIQIQRDKEKGIPVQQLESNKNESVEALSFRLEEVQRKFLHISETFADFYGENDAKMWFEQVKSNFSRYLDDDRRIFKQLANLQSEKLHLEQLIRMKRKREQYATLSLAELTEVVMKLEDKLLKYESEAGGDNKGLGCKYLTSIGGMAEGKAMPHCFVFDLETQQRQQLPDLPTARSLSAAVAIGSQIYVAGGQINSSVWTTAFEIFDFISGQWASYDVIPAVLTDIKGSVHGDNILVWGRNENLFLIFMYDTAKRVWEVIPSPPDQSESELHITYAQNQMICQSIFKIPKEKYQQVYDMKLFVLKLNEPSLYWTEVDHNLSSLKALLSAPVHGGNFELRNLKYARSYGHTIYIDDTNPTYRYRNPAWIVPDLYSQGLHAGAHVDAGSTRFWSYSVRTNRHRIYSIQGYCTGSVSVSESNGTITNDAAKGMLLACHDGFLIYQHNGGVKLIIPSEATAMNIHFRDPSEPIDGASVAVVNPAESCQTGHENSPC